MGDYFGDVESLWAELGTQSPYIFILVMCHLVTQEPVQFLFLSLKTGGSDIAKGSLKVS